MAINFNSILDDIYEAIEYFFDALLYVVSAVVIGLIVSLAGTLVNIYSFTIAYVIFVLFLPIVSWFDDLEEFLKRHLGFLIGVIIVSGAFFHDYWLVTAAIIGIFFSFLREWYDNQ